MDNVISQMYDSSFYAGKDGAYQAGRVVAPFILSLFPEIDSIVDIGCGAGGWLAAFAELGKKVEGYDFGAGVEENLLISPKHYHRRDLSQSIEFGQKADLAISLEVAEHIDVAASDIFIDNLCHAGDIILFSAAIPGQGGTYHVNCQWPSWWAKKFSGRDYMCFDILRPIFWNMENIAVWYRQNMMLFVNAAFAKERPRLHNYSNLYCLPVIHPQLP